MKAKTKFLKMFNWLSEEARRNLVHEAYGNNPMSIDAIYWEVRNDTELGKRMLFKLGFKDD